MKQLKFLLPILVVVLTLAFPTDIPYTIEGLLNKLDQSLEKVKNPNFSKTYQPPSLVPYATSRIDSHPIYFHMEIYRPSPYYRPPLGYRSVVIYTPLPYYPPVAYPPPIVYQPAPNYLDVFLLKELLGTKEELKETQKEVEKLKEKVEQLQGKAVCPSCKREVDPNWTFCPYDGTPLKKESKDKRRISLYAEALEKAFKSATGGSGFLAVELSSLEGLSEEDKREVLNELKMRLMSPNVYSLADVKNDEEKFQLDEQGRIRGVKNGVVLFLAVGYFKEESAQLKVACWLSPEKIMVVSYEAKFADGRWQLTEQKEI